MPTRREFLGGTLIAGAGLMAGCGGDDGGATPRTLGADDVLLGLYPRAMQASGEEAVVRALARLDLSCLSLSSWVQREETAAAPDRPRMCRIGRAAAPSCAETA